MANLEAKTGRYVTVPASLSAYVSAVQRVLQDGGDSPFAWVAPTKLTCQLMRKSASIAVNESALSCAWDADHEHIDHT